jgi:hypothetical protein
MVNKLAFFENNKFEEFHKNILNDEGNGKVA